ncbi:hypothetical protein EDEG_00925 [Edhazardia aedis USNM 41457]|uniref:Uncharacterized protein n=1 Tax=Edhazardia aedis (strain USNM 41457) TaxID=1003232 RepID=J9DUF7_EDHAE|nr:hypothetical protein EDEG_00925 [Edhazardia aedis USNM 41457]|eukprot:EJW04932.1 hypothetical protein EDEG_00925 [Edhazardia aedis USNM 41457]
MKREQRWIPERHQAINKINRYESFNNIILYNFYISSPYLCHEAVILFLNSINKNIKGINTKLITKEIKRTNIFYPDLNYQSLNFFQHYALFVFIIIIKFIDIINIRDLKSF